MGLKVYGHLPGYLHRWVVLRAGRIMVRLHKILDIDRTPFLHSHPFWYISLVLRGGYEERVLQADGSLKKVVRRPGSLVLRRPGTFHRIDAVSTCTTLFLTFKSPLGWALRRHAQVAAPIGYRLWPDGLYAQDGGWRRREQGIWYIKKPTATEAGQTDKLSIHQNPVDRMACPFVAKHHGVIRESANDSCYTDAQTEPRVMPATRGEINMCRVHPVVSKCPCP